MFMGSPFIETEPIFPLNLLTVTRLMDQVVEDRVLLSLSNVNGLYEHSVSWSKALLKSSYYNLLLL